MTKKEELQKIKEDMEVDKELPLISKPEDVIPGDGNPDAKIVFIREKISGKHGKKFMIKWHNRSLIVVPMYHPAAALRNGNIMSQFREDFLNLPKIFEEVNKPEIKQMDLI